jgi:hypothetical protein
MNIEEARNVLWLKSNYRPLGELLDEGYLTKDRLEWAAQWAYNPKLKQAAQVILESAFFSLPIAAVEEMSKAIDNKEKDPGIPIGISLDSAHSTPWPFAPYKGRPMGALVESNQLSLKDLAYAIESAWDGNVRKAATAFSLIRLNQIVKEPVPPAGFVRVISGGRSRSEREQLRLALKQGLVFGIALTIVMVLLIGLGAGFVRSHPSLQAIVRTVSASTQTTWFYIALGSFIFIAWLVASIPGWNINRLDKQIENHRQGQEGEEKVIQTIVHALDGNWHLFRNVSLPGRDKGNLDLVLVGPSGVWFLEVKNFNGKYRNVGKGWQYQRGRNWITLSKSPSEQALNNVDRLKNFLKANDEFVNAAIVWANEESSLSVENPSVVVWRYNRLPDELGNIWQGEKLSKLEQDKIVEKLTKLCKRQNKSQGLPEI